jgi:hypothetical protein
LRFWDVAGHFENWHDWVIGEPSHLGTTLDTTQSQRFDQASGTHNWTSRHLHLINNTQIGPAFSVKDTTLHQLLPRDFAHRPRLSAVHCRQVCCHHCDNHPERSLNLHRTGLFPGHYLYGDAGYGLNEWLLRPFQSVGIGKKETKFNKALSRGRVSVEWFFGEVVQYWAHVDFKKGMKIGKSPLVQCISCPHFLRTRSCAPTRRASQQGISTVRFRFG